MLSAQVVGSVGVGMLLLAFFLNLLGFLRSQARQYQVLNIIGAGLSCYASYLIGFVPFVILEATWCAAALLALLRLIPSASEA
ncbi:MAG: CBU_0592 family membrane protein [Candidatus Binataceae bacterium]